MPLICEGCGQAVPIPSGYRRNKIQCVCGVICVVPESARRESAAPSPRQRSAPSSVEEDAERWLLDDEPAPSSPTSKSVKKPTPPQPAKAKEEPVYWPSVDANGDADNNDEDEEDSSPYTLVGGEEVRCPKCGLILPPGSVLCIRCGFHLKKRKKIAKTYQPIERVWETNYSLSTRLALFGAIEVVAFLAMGLPVVFTNRVGLGVFLFTFFTVTTITAFLLGTFDHIYLSRDKRGWVRLVKTWRVAFFRLQPKAIDLRDYEGIVSDQRSEVSVWEYWIWFFLFLFGVFPALIWWYQIMYKITYRVALTRNHGFPAYLVYSGRNEKQMKEIAYALNNATALPYSE